MAIFYTENMKKSLAYLLSYCLPIFALAQIQTGSSATVESLLRSIVTKVVVPFMNFLLVLATLVFLWGVIQYVIAGDSSDKTERAKRHIVWGLIGLAVMGSANVIVRIISDTLFGL